MTRKRMLVRTGVLGGSALLVLSLTAVSCNSSDDDDDCNGMPITTRSAQTTNVAFVQAQPVAHTQAGGSIVLADGCGDNDSDEGDDNDG